MLSYISFLSLKTKTRITAPFFDLILKLKGNENVIEVSQSFNQEIPKHSNYYGRFAMHPKKKTKCKLFMFCACCTEH